MKLQNLKIGSTLLVKHRDEKAIGTIVAIGGTKGTSYRMLTVELADGTIAYAPALEHELANG